MCPWGVPWQQADCVCTGDFGYPLGNIRRAPVETVSTCNPGVLFPRVPFRAPVETERIEGHPWKPHPRFPRVPAAREQREMFPRVTHVSTGARFRRFHVCPLQMFRRPTGFHGRPARAQFPETVSTATRRRPFRRLTFRSRPRCFYGCLKAHVNTVFTYALRHP